MQLKSETKIWCWPVFNREQLWKVLWDKSIREATLCGARYGLAMASSFTPCCSLEKVFTLDSILLFGAGWVWTSGLKPFSCLSLQSSEGGAVHSSCLGS